MVLVAGSKTTAPNIKRHGAIERYQLLSAVTAMCVRSMFADLNCLPDYSQLL